MAEAVCPNCGHPFVEFWIERQAAGRREVVLEWAMCTHCRHVGLRQWNFADGPLPNPKTSEQQPQKAEHKPLRADRSSRR